MSTLTILHTIETGGPGGAETVVLNLASNLDSRRFRSLALVPDGPWLPHKLRERGVPTYLVESRPWYDPRPMARMARLLEREKVDVIHSHLPDQNFYSCLAGRLTGRKTVVTYHGPCELAQGKGFKASMKLWYVRRSASAIVVVCDFVGQMLREVGFPSDKIVRIYNGIEVGRFCSPKTGRLREEIGCREEAKLIGMVANVRASKGYEFFIRAARKVLDAFPLTRFVSIGDMDGTLGQPLRDLVQQLGLEGRFFFLGFRGDVPEILSDLDVFVLSSVSEGFPLVTLEAMAAGRPVIATRCGGPQEVVEDGRTGFLVQPADSDGLAIKICELIGEPESAAALGQRGRAKVLGEFSLEQMVRQYECLYERLSSSR